MTIRTAMRSSAILLVFLASAAQPSAAAPLAGLVLELFEPGRAHSVSMVDEGGHRHLVLTHVEEGAADAAPHDHGAAAFCDRDHVFHVMSGDAPAANAKRGEVSPLAAVSPLAPPSRRLIAVPRLAGFQVSGAISRPIVLRL